MVIDTSALAAIFFAEPERQKFLGAITSAESRLVSAATLLETGIVVEARQGESAGREFDLFVVRADLQVVPVDSEQVEIADPRGADMERAGIERASTETVLLTRSRNRLRNRCWRRARAFHDRHCNRSIVSPWSRQARPRPAAAPDEVRPGLHDPP